MLTELCACVILHLFGQCCGAMYQLNDTEYERLPRLFELENYEECMDDAGGVYCVANLELYADSTNDLHTLIREYSEHTLKHYNYTKIDRGICVTRTCETYARNAGLDIKKDLRVVLEGCLNETMINKYDLMARVHKMNCEKENEKYHRHLDISDYIFLGVVIMLIVLTLVGSFCDVYTNDNDKKHKNGVSGKDFLLCFSVAQNYKWLTTVEEQSDPRLNIFKSIHALRTIATFFIVYAHTVLLIGTGFTSDPHSFEKAYESVTLRISFSGLNIVQVFIFFSNMLLAYFMQVSSETRNVSWKMIPKIIFYRWWRLTPSAAMLVAFSATWMRHLGSGPLWSTFITNGSAAQCRRYFWAHVFYFNNYIAEDTVCVLPTWYIGADMQLFIAGVIIHFAIRNRSRNFKIITLTSLLLLSMVTPALHVWLQDLDAFAMQTPELCRTISDANFRKLHVLGHNNLSCTIIGMAAGYLIYYLQQKKLEYPNFQIGGFLCWCAIPMYILLLYCGSLFFFDGERPSLALRVIYAATNRAVIGFIVMFWMLGVTLKFNGFSKAIMEWPGWVIPSRLNYCVYLLHFVFIEFGLAIRSQLTPVSFFNTFFLAVGIWVATYAIAVPFHLLIEAPTTRLMKLSSNQKADTKLD